MPKPLAVRQLPLFEQHIEPARQRGGIPRHVPTLESMLLANEMKAAGATWAEITQALGICSSTLATHYFPSPLANPPMGRRRHSPTSATRIIVRRAIDGGMTQAKVAKLLGVSVPTLRLYYRNELQR
ncbi:hypothetical protein [Novosphingobium sp.]|uniref:hypothetical protein n=1 Tax=Novosphingobium sp. TaxID=1874826 RepID=UPI00286DDC96|nr:hypothetical protein [Novosphingobium sp.]